MKIDELLLLLIDDDEDDLELLTEVITDVDPSVVCKTARNGAEAMSVLRDLPRLPRFVFLDRNMPLMSGMDCLKEMRKNPHLDSVHVIMYTTAPMLPHEVDVFVSLNARYYQKPYTMQKMRDMVADILRK